MTVIFHGGIIKYTNGEKSIEPNVNTTKNPTLRTLAHELGRIYGESFHEFLTSHETNLFLINGKGTSLTGGLNTPIKQGDRIEIIEFVDAG
jgi:molybdopterin converting factor small subunit